MSEGKFSVPIERDAVPCIERRAAIISTQPKNVQAAVSTVAVAPQRGGRIIKRVGIGIGCEETQPASHSLFKLRLQ